MGRIELSDGIAIETSGNQLIIAGVSISGDVLIANSINATGVVSGESVSVTGVVSGESVSVTGDVSGGSVSATGVVSGESVSVTGDVSGGSVSAGSSGITSSGIIKSYNGFDMWYGDFFHQGTAIFDFDHTRLNVIQNTEVRRLNGGQKDSGILYINRLGVYELRDTYGASTYIRLISDKIHFYRSQTTVSDDRFKKNEKQLLPEHCIQIMRSIKPYTYDYKNEFTSEKCDIGYIANDVEEFIPGAVSTSEHNINTGNILCSFLIENSKIHLYELVDNEFDASCNFKMLFCSLDYIELEKNEYSIEGDNLYLYLQHNEQKVKEYIYAHKENIKVRIDSQEYTTTLVYDKNIELNQLKIDITNIPITEDVSCVEIYGPSEFYDFESPVVEKTTNEETGLTNYTLELSEEQLEEIKDKPYDTMIWYAVKVKDGRSLNYNQIFMHYHGAIQYLDKENVELKNEVASLKTELQQIKQHLGL